MQLVSSEDCSLAATFDTYHIRWYWYRLHKSIRANTPGWMTVKKILGNRVAKKVKMKRNCSLSKFVHLRWCEMLFPAIYFEYIFEIDCTLLRSMYRTSKRYSQWMWGIVTKLLKVMNDEPLTKVLPFCTECIFALHKIFSQNRSIFSFRFSMHWKTWVCKSQAYIAISSWENVHAHRIYILKL